MTVFGISSVETLCPLWLGSLCELCESLAFFAVKVFGPLLCLNLRRSAKLNLDSDYRTLLIPACHDRHRS
jgi:hypothetical protein